MTSIEEYQVTARKLENALEEYQGVLRQLSLEYPESPWSETIGEKFRVAKMTLWSTTQPPIKTLQGFDWNADIEPMYGFGFS